RALLRRAGHRNRQAGIVDHRRGGGAGGADRLVGVVGEGGLHADGMGLVALGHGVGVLIGADIGPAAAAVGHLPLVGDRRTGVVAVADRRRRREGRALLRRAGHRNRQAGIVDHRRGGGAGGADRLAGVVGEGGLHADGMGLVALGHGVGVLIGADIGPAAAAVGHLPLVGDRRTGVVAVADRRRRREGRALLRRAGHRNRQAGIVDHRRGGGAGGADRLAGVVGEGGLHADGMGLVALGHGVGVLIGADIGPAAAAVGHLPLVGDRRTGVVAVADRRRRREGRALLRRAGHRNRQAGIVDHRRGGGAGGADRLAGVVGEGGLHADGMGLVALGHGVGVLIGADIGPAAAAVGHLPLVGDRRTGVVAVADRRRRREGRALLRRAGHRNRQAGIVDHRRGGGAGGADRLAGVVGEGGLHADGMGLVALGHGVGVLIGADIGPAAAAVGHLPLVGDRRTGVVAVADRRRRREGRALLRRAGHRNRQAGIVDHRRGGGAGGADRLAGVVGEGGLHADGMGLVALGHGVGVLIGADIGPAAAAVGHLPLVTVALASSLSPIVGVAVRVEPSFAVPVTATDRLELSITAAVAVLVALTVWLVSSVKEACTRMAWVSSPSA